MDQQSTSHFSQLHELVNAHVTPILKEKLCGQMEVIQDVQNSLQNYRDKTQAGATEVTILELVREMKSLKDTITKSVNDHAPIGEEINLDKDFAAYLEALQSVTEQIPEQVIGKQDESHFTVIPEDSLLLRLGKRVKQVVLLVDRWPQNAANWWRRLRKVQPKPPRAWKREIPARAITQWYFRDTLFVALNEAFAFVFRKIATSSNALWQIESEMDKEFAGIMASNPADKVQAPQVDYQEVIQTLLEEIHDSKRTLASMMDEVLDSVYQEYDSKSGMVGTLALSSKQFGPAKLQRRNQTAGANYKKSLQAWGNTLTVLSDHYNLDQELYQLRYANLEQYFFASQKLDLKVNDKIASALKEISQHLEERKGQLESASDAPEDLGKVIKEVRYDLNKSLKQSVPKLTKLIFDQNIPALIDNLEIKIKNEVSQLSNTRAVVKDITYDQGIQQSEIDQISPRELIAFEALPTFLKEIKVLKSDLVHNLDHTQHNLLEIAEICDFNLATALAALEEPPEEEATPKTLALEGMERALARLQDISNGLTELQENIDGKLKVGVTSFNQSVHALNEIQTVFDIKVRIAKAKALEKTKALKNQALEYFQNFIPRLVSKFKRRWLLVNKYYLETTKKYGISRTTQNLSAEVSSFLSETDAAISQLPFVYQRLFEINPLENPNFYETRLSETQKLQKAYQNWEKGHFGATALVGEAGSGTTTLTHFFLEELKSRHHTIRTDSPAQIYNKQDFVAYFKEVFNAPDLVDLDQLVEHLNGLSGKRIIILENLQHFYLRKVNGFACLKLFYELISRTNNNIFWLTTINLHAYHYLNKTSQIEDFFAYSIFMESLKDAQVTNIVLRRHRVSGYNTWFKPSKNDRKSSRYQKLSEPERQKYLEKEFFSGLNKLAHSNITVALIFWLRSTIKVEEDTITIGSLKDLDFSFLSNLNSDKLFTLHALLLHDGITVDDHAQVFQQSLEKSQLVLILLYEDGIVIRKEARYFINPLLFRQIVNMLKAKNILH